MKNDLDQQGRVHADEHQHKGQEKRQVAFPGLARPVQVHQDQQSAGSADQHENEDADPLPFVLCFVFFAPV